MKEWKSEFTVEDVQRARRDLVTSVMAYLAGADGLESELKAIVDHALKCPLKRRVAALALPAEPPQAEELNRILGNICDRWEGVANDIREDPTYEPLDRAIKLLYEYLLHIPKKPRVFVAEDIAALKKGNLMDADDVCIAIAREIVADYDRHCEEIDDPDPAWLESEIIKRFTHGASATPAPSERTCEYCGGTDVCEHGYCRSGKCDDSCPHCPRKRPTIAELEEILKSEEPRDVVVNPDGSIRTVPRKAQP